MLQLHSCIRVVAGWTVLRFLGVLKLHFSFMQSCFHLNFFLHFSQILFLNIYIGELSSQVLKNHLRYLHNFWQDNPDIYAHSKITPRNVRQFFSVVSSVFAILSPADIHVFYFNFRFQREIKFHTFTICSASSIDSFSRRLERFFFLPYTHSVRLSGENKNMKVHELTTWGEDCWANTNSSNV